MELGRVFIEQQIRPTITVTDEEVAAFYNENPQYFTTGETGVARGTSCSRRTRTPILDTDAAAKAKAEAAHQRAVAGEDFAELAKELSEGPSGPNGGDLGFFEKATDGPSTLPTQPLRWSPARSPRWSRPNSATTSSRSKSAAVPGTMLP